MPLPAASPQHSHQPAKAAMPPVPQAPTSVSSVQATTAQTEVGDLSAAAVSVSVCSSSSSSTGVCAMSDDSPWQQLFEPCPFFFQYEHYLELRLFAPNDTDLAKWEGYALSRIRKLVQALEYTGAVTYVHPYNSQAHRSKGKGKDDFVNQNLEPQPTTPTPQSGATGPVSLRSGAGGSYCYLYLGFELCPHWARANSVVSSAARQKEKGKALPESATARASAVGGAVHAMMAPVLKYFVATELEYQYPGSGGVNSIVGVDASYVPWSGLAFPAETNVGVNVAASSGIGRQGLFETHSDARGDIIELQHVQWLHEQHQYEQQQKNAMQQQQQCHQQYHQQHHHSKHNRNSRKQSNRRKGRK